MLFSQGNLPDPGIKNQHLLHWQEDFQKTELLGFSWIFKALDRERTRTLLWTLQAHCRSDSSGPPITSFIFSLTSCLTEDEAEGRMETGLAGRLGRPGES